jgi:hypothetical protein
MSVAILISGQMRTAKKCYKSILKNLPQGDFYIHTVQDSNSEDAELFDPVRLVIEPQSEMPEKPEYTWAIGNNCYGVQRVLKQLWGLKRVWHFFNSHITKYDWVIRCRPDLVFTSPVEDVKMWEKDITVPKFSNFFGLNDRFAILNTSTAQKYFNRLDLLDEYIFQGGMFHPETFLQWVCKDKYNLQINRTNTSFFSLRENGDQDAPWYGKEFGDILD